MFETLEKCPICLGSGPFEKTGTYPIRLSDDEITYVRCPDCTGEFHNPMWDAETTREWYASGSYLFAIVPPPTGARQTEQALKRLLFLKKHVKRVNRFLEFGSGNGHFMRAVAEAYGAEVVGLEADPSRKEASKTPDSIDGGFDLIAAIHSLEHCPRPAEVLEGLITRLTPGGYVLLEVPVTGGYLTKYNESHPMAFNEKSLLTLTGKLGLRLTASGEPGHKAGYLGLFV